MSGDGRFRRGQSGNPKGRPRGARNSKTVSAFAVVFDRMIKVREGSSERELSAEEALQLRVYQQALKGSRMAQRTIMKMIAKREAWRAKHEPAERKQVEIKHERPDLSGKAIAAMVLLGIATEDETGSPGEHLLEPWAVEAALQRSRGRKLDRLDVANIRVSVRAWTTLDLQKYRDECGE